MSSRLSVIKTCCQVFMPNAGDIKSRPLAEEHAQGPKGLSEHVCHHREDTSSSERILLVLRQEWKMVNQKRCLVS